MKKEFGDKVRYGTLDWEILGDVPLLPDRRETRLDMGRVMDVIMMASVFSSAGERNRKK